MQKENGCKEGFEGKKNKLSFPMPPSAGLGNLHRFVKAIRRRSPIKALGDDNYLRAFTLIELLVVVLIIGILAAVALPQYQKTVEKSKAAQAWVVLNAFYQAYARYYLANGGTATDIAELDVDMPWTDFSAFTGNGTYPTIARANEDWTVELYRNSEDLAGVCVGRLRGAYTGGGFCRFLLVPNSYTWLEADKIYCVERVPGPGVVFQKNKGDYCQKMFNGTFKGRNNFNFFTLP